MIDLDCNDSMIFVWQTVPQYDDLHCILWESCCQQRRIFDNRIVLAVARVRVERFERFTPTIRNAPLCFVAHRSYGKVNCPVDHANACASASTGALPAQVDQLLCEGGAGLGRLTLHDKFKVFCDDGLYATPFFQ